MNNRNITQALLRLSKIFNQKIQWCVFGGVAVAIHNGNFFRRNGDIEIIINDIEDLSELKKCSNVNLINKNKKGRIKYGCIMEGVKIEFLFFIGKNKIKLADDIFEFKEVVEKELNGIKIPVVDLPSLSEAKLRHKKSLHDNISRGLNEYKKILVNTKKDIKIINSLLKLWQI